MESIVLHCNKMSYESYQPGNGINVYSCFGNSCSKTSYNQINQNDRSYPFIQPGNLGDYK
jgi:hypothetical protein